MGDKERFHRAFPFNNSTEECGKTRLHRTATFASDCNKNRHLSSGRAGWEEGSERGDGVVVSGNQNASFSCFFSWTQIKISFHKDLLKALHRLYRIINF